MPVPVTLYVMQVFAATVAGVPPGASVVSVAQPDEHLL